MKQKRFFQLSSIALACATLMACGSSHSDDTSSNTGTSHNDSDNTIQLQQQLANAKAKLQQAQSELANKQQSLASYQQSLQKTTSELNSAKQQLATVNTTLTTVITQVNKQKAEVSRLTSQVNELTQLQKLGNSAEVQQKLAQAKQNLANANATLQTTQSQYTLAQKQAESLTKNVSTLEKAQQALTTQVKQKQTELEQLKASISSSEIALKKEKAQLDNLSKDETKIVEARREENYWGDKHKWRSIKIYGGSIIGSAYGKNDYSNSRDVKTDVLVSDSHVDSVELEIDFSKNEINSQKIQSKSLTAQTCASASECHLAFERTIGQARFVNQSYSTYFSIYTDRYSDGEFGYSKDDKYTPNKNHGVGYVYRELPQDNRVWQRPSGQEEVTYRGKVLGYWRQDQGNGQYKPHLAQGDLTLTANFADKTVSGKVTNRTNYENNQDIVLIKTPIIDTDSARWGYTDHQIGFSGEIQYGHYDVNRPSDGEYEGIFVGPNAEEVVGEIKDSDVTNRQIFGGTSK
ncbi:transferrin-binding protein-like solute binding protein [Avibacterium sp. 21-595]|uniref:factor H binding protein domain-containing protein n=1 Tax=Avibacterium sp. 21-595 TaxID=2911527 RepID=UPI00202613BF|nr:factor H binding protein domain-containing protein [Avibacterium sp. 21-595]URL07409.1 transferrin-binding protein-like solute binding protein [Avibacterium sp. 21-595]